MNINLEEIQKVADDFEMIVRDDHQGSFQTYYKSEDGLHLEEVDRSDLPSRIEDFLLNINLLKFK